MTNKPLEAATAYTRKGWKVVPVAPGAKGTHLAEWQSLRLTESELPDYFQPDSNVGILLGTPSGGLTDIDLDCPEAIHAGRAFLPSTALSGRGSNMSHYWYVAPGAENVVYKDTDGSVLMEVRSEKRQTVVEPSTHPSGDKYKWFNDLDPKEITWEDLHRKANFAATSTLIARHLPDGGRHDLALAFAGFLLKHISGNDVYEILKTAWELRNPAADAFKDLLAAVQNTEEKMDSGEPFTGRGTLDQLLPGVPQKISKWFGWQTVSGDATDKTDFGNATLFAERYGQDVKWVYEWKKWAFWTGKRWERDDIGYVKHLATQTIHGLFKEASTSASEEAKSIAKHALSSLSNGKIESMIAMAKTVPGMAVSAEEFDKDLYLLNCDNGTLDLNTGQLRPHDRLDMITRMVPVAYRPGAKAPRFERFVEEILPNAETRQFVHRAIGYSLTGDTSERCLFIAQGPGNNGKSTLLNTCADVLGDYAVRANAEVFLDKPAGSIPNDVAELKGARLVLASEIENNRRLSEAQVKNFTGGSDKLKARFLYGEFFEFYPKFTAWILTNPLPRIKGTDQAIWNRLRIIPFHTIPPVIDTHLPTTLKKEYEGILVWMVQGFQDYLRNELPQPPEVHNMKSSYRVDQDAVARFVAEECSVGPSLSELLDKLYAEYKDWCVENEEFTLNKQRFGQRLDDLNFGYQKDKRRVLRTGLCYGTDDGEGPDDGTDPDPTNPPDKFDPLGRVPGVATTERDAIINATTRQRVVPDNRSDVARSDTGHQDLADAGNSGASGSGGVDGREVRQQTSVDTAVAVSPGDEQHVVEEGADGHESVAAESGGYAGEVHSHVPVHEGDVDAPANLDDSDAERQVHDAGGVGSESAALDVWALDTETTGLDPRSDSVRLLTVYNPRVPEFSEPVHYDLDTEYKAVLALLRSLAGKEIVLHNARFDLPFLERLCSGFTSSVARVWDTLVLNQLTYAGKSVAPRVGYRTSHSLDACLQREGIASLDKSHQSSNWRGELSEAQIQYALDDVRYLPALLAALRRKCDTSDEIVELEMDLVPVVAAMKERGIMVDREGWEQKADEVQEIINYLEYKLDRFGRVAVARAAGDVADTGEYPPVSEWNWGSPSQVVEVANYLDIFINDSRDDTLAEHTEHAFIRLMRQHRKYSKLLKSYGRNWVEVLDGNNVVHPDWLQASTDTGRMACKGPNMQQLPNEAGYRSLVVPRPGNVFIVADYSQIELRIAAKISREPELLKAYERGEDVHTLTAQRITGKEEITKEDRRLAKAVNFGLLYGMGARRLQSYALTAYGLTLSESEAKKYRSRWLSAYPFIRQWHRGEGSALDAAKGQPGTNLRTKTLAGRVRHHVDMYSERLNTPVQGSGADGLKRALYKVARECPGEPVLVVHDEIVVECPADQADAAADSLQRLMVEGMDEMVNVGRKGPHVPIEVETVVADRWEK